MDIDKPEEGSFEHYCKKKREKKEFFSDSIKQPERSRKVQSTEEERAKSFWETVGDLDLKVDTLVVVSPNPFPKMLMSKQKRSYLFYRTTDCSEFVLFSIGGSNKAEIARDKREQGTKSFACGKWTDFQRLFLRWLSDGLGHMLSLNFKPQDPKKTIARYERSARYYLHKIESLTNQPEVRRLVVRAFTLIGEHRPREARELIQEAIKLSPWPKHIPREALP